MKKYHLDELLQTLANRPVPVAPMNLHASVWREIRNRREVVPRSWVEELAALLWARPVALASVAAVIVIGTAMAQLLDAGSPAQPVRHPLNLEVFSEFAPSLPSTILSRKP